MRYARTSGSGFGDLLPGRVGHVGGTAKDNRLFVEAVSYTAIARGFPGGTCPARFGDFRVIHTRHMRWSRSGVWEQVFQHLAADADNEYAMIDATIIRVHQHGAGGKRGDPSAEGLGRSCGGLEYQTPCDL